MTREELQAEYKELRNAKMKRPGSSNTRARNIYLDHLIETDQMAERKTDEELQAAIDRMKREQM